MRSLAAALLLTATLPFSAVAGENVRVIQIEASEMTFHPESVSVTPGEHIEFVVTNRGQLPHEFVIGKQADQAVHREQMQAGHGHGHSHHHEASLPAVTVAPGETKRLAWTAPEHIHGELEFACNIAGHYEAGMSGRFERSS